MNTSINGLARICTQHRNSSRGQDLTEYALLVVMIAIVVLIAVMFFGQEVSSFFQNAANSLADWLLGG